MELTLHKGTVRLCKSIIKASTLSYCKLHDYEGIYWQNCLQIGVDYRLLDSWFFFKVSFIKCLQNNRRG